MSILEGGRARPGQEASRAPIYTPARLGLPGKGWGWGHCGSPWKAYPAPREISDSVTSLLINLGEEGIAR